MSIPISDRRTLKFQVVNEATYRPPSNAVLDHQVAVIELMARNAVRTSHKDRRLHLERMALNGSSNIK